MVQRRGGTEGWRRWVVAFFCGAAAVVVTYLSREQDSRPLGRYLFYIVMAYTLVHLFVTTRGACGRFFSEERRHRTLGLLFLTGLKPGEIMLGKFAGVYAAIMFPVWGALPLLAFAMLMGGISDGVFLASVETVVVLPLLVLSIQMAASILMQDEHAAEIVALGVMLVLALVPPLLLTGLEIATGTAPSPEWFALGPANAPWQLFQNTRDARLEVVFTGNAISLSYAIVLLLGAGWLLKRAWRNELEGEAGALQRKTKAWRELQDRASARARALLETHPYGWLVARDARPGLLAWGSLLGLFLLWLAGWAIWPAKWLTPFTCWATCFILGILANGVMHYMAGRQIAEDRRSGALELLLTTPLNPAEIIEAQGVAIRRMTSRFTLVVGAIYGWFFLLGAMVMQEWTIPSLINYGAFWSVLVCLGPWSRKGGYWHTFWVSLNTGRLAYGLRRHTAALWNLPMLIFFYANGTLFALLNAPINDYAVALTFGCGAVVFLLVWYFSWREQLLPLRAKAAEEFRHIAAQPVPAAGDPRLKRWNMSESLFEAEEPEEQEYSGPLWRGDPAGKLLRNRVADGGESGKDGKVRARD